MISKIKGQRDVDHDVRFDDLLQVVMEFQKKKDAASILGTWQIASTVFHKYYGQRVPVRPCCLESWRSAAASTILCQKWPQVLQPRSIIVGCSCKRSLWKRTRSQSIEVQLDASSWHPSKTRFKSFRQSVDCLWLPVQLYVQTRSLDPYNCANKYASLLLSISWKYYCTTFCFVLQQT